MTPSIANLLIFLLAAAGVLLMLISAVGILRLPDVFTRMHAAGKAATLGVSCLLLSTGIFFWEEEQFWRMIALIALFFVTAPIATTTMARAAYSICRYQDFALRHDDMRRATAETAHRSRGQVSDQTGPTDR